MLNCLVKIGFVGVALTLAGCSSLYGEDGLVKDTSQEYLAASQTKDIEMPAGLSHKTKVDYAPVPQIGSKAQKAPIGSEIGFVAPTQILAVLDNVRVNKQAENPTVYIIEDSSFLLNSIISLFEEKEIRLAKKDLSQNIIETEWVSLDERGVWLGMAGEEDLEDFRAKFRVTMESGVLNGEKQLTVERFDAQKYNDDTDKWQAIPSFWEDSAQMLNMVISNYDKVASERDKELRTKNLAGFKVRLAKDEDDNAALVTEVDIDQAWSKVPEVLKTLNFDVNDRDRRLMTYFVKYENEEPGFFASLFDSDKKALPLESGEYQVTVRQLGELTAIIFRDGQGAPLSSEIMVKLYPELSKSFGANR